MKYTQEGDTVTLTMSHADYCELMFMLGASLGAKDLASPIAPENEIHYRRVHFLNRLNEGNHMFHPYYVPGVFQR